MSLRKEANLLQVVQSLLLLTQRLFPLLNCFREAGDALLACLCPACNSLAQQMQKINVVPALYCLQCYSGHL